MYKKILALCLSVAIAMSAAITPIFADNINPVSRKDDSTNLLSMPDKNKQNNGNHQGVLKRFTDSDTINWAEKSIEKLGALGILNGVENGLFKPNNNVTHMEAIAMVLRLKGEEAQAKAITKQPEYFKGQSAKWAWGYLQLALDEGIIIPSEDEWFNPNTPAKRHEIAKYIVRALGKRDDALKNMKANLSFKDASAIPKSSVGYVYVINHLGIMQGSKNEFQPNKPITRAEMAVLLDRATDSFDDSIVNDNELEGVFVAYNKANSTITMNIDNTQRVFKVNSNAPVYRNNTYYLMDTLKPGDIIEVVLDENDRIIFIEFKEESTTPATGQPLSIQHVDYSSLPTELKNRIDELKDTENYVAFRSDHYVYLVAARGQMPSGGYNIRITNVYSKAVHTGQYNLEAVVEAENPTRSVVIQAITYPYDIIKLAYFDGIDKVKFIDEENTLLEETTLDSLDEDAVIEGIIDSIDEEHRTIRLKESDNITRSYFIPTNAQIIINDRASAFDALKEDMTVEITKTNGVITRLEAENEDDIVKISGRISDVDVLDRAITLLESDGLERDYVIPRNAHITLNGRDVAISSLHEGMTAVITETNGVITKLAAENPTNSTETINGKITSIDTENKIVGIKESNNVERTYYIPSTVQITLNSRRVELSALAVNMTVAVTRTNGVISRLAATQSTQTINGKVDSVDETHNILKVLESNNTVNSYDIPDDAQILLNNEAADLADLVKGMSVVITKVDGAVAKVAAQNHIQTVEGVLINVYPSANNSTINVKVGSTYKTYVITSEAEVYCNSHSITIQQMPLNITIAIKIVNGIVTEVRNK